MKAMTRPYNQNKRAEAQNQTRQKIVEAAIELRGAKGIRATSMNDIAERANVAKVTVYRHFPELDDLVKACSGQYFQRHPFPELEVLREIRDPVERLREGLKEIYTYHRATATMISTVLPEIRDHPLFEPYLEHWRNAVEILSEPWPNAPNIQLTAALSLAVAFETWKLMADSLGMDDHAIMQLMVNLVAGIS